MTLHIHGQSPGHNIRLITSVSSPLSAPLTPTIWPQSHGSEGLLCRLGDVSLSRSRHPDEHTLVLQARAPLAFTTTHFPPGCSRSFPTSLATSVFINDSFYPGFISGLILAAFPEWWVLFPSRTWWNSWQGAVCVYACMQPVKSTSQGSLGIPGAGLMCLATWVLRREKMVRKRPRQQSGRSQLSDLYDKYIYMPAGAAGQPVCPPARSYSSPVTSVGWHAKVSTCGSSLAVLTCACHFLFAYPWLLVHLWQHMTLPNTHLCLSTCIHLSLHLCECVPPFSCLPTMFIPIGATSRCLTTRYLPLFLCLSHLSLWSSLSLLHSLCINLSNPLYVCICPLSFP